MAVPRHRKKRTGSHRAQRRPAARLPANVLGAGGGGYVSRSEGSVRTTGRSATDLQRRRPRRTGTAAAIFIRTAGPPPPLPPKINKTFTLARAHVLAPTIPTHYHRDIHRRRRTVDNARVGPWLRVERYYVIVCAACLALCRASFPAASDHFINFILLLYFTPILFLYIRVVFFFLYFLSRLFNIFQSFLYFIILLLS